MSSNVRMVMSMLEKLRKEKRGLNSISMEEVLNGLKCTNPNV